MSWMASSASLRSASGSTFRNVRPSGPSTVETPSEVTRRYGVVSSPWGSGSDADRDRVADILREALAEGRLTADEHAERVDGVYRAKTHADLEPLVRDLPGAHTPRRSTAPAPAPNRPATGAVPAVAGDNV